MVGFTIQVIYLSVCTYQQKEAVKNDVGQSVISK